MQLDLSVVMRSWTNFHEHNCAELLREGDRIEGMGRGGITGRIECPLECAQRECDGDHNTDARRNKQPGERDPGTFEDRELGDESAESRQAH